MSRDDELVSEPSESAARRWLVNCSLIVASVLFSFLILETIVRMAYGSPLVFRDPQVRHVITNYGYKLEPNQTGTFTVGAPVVTNSFGFRDREWAVPKPAGQIRVMVIGDSLSFGNSVPGEDAFPHLLEVLLQDRFDDIEVVNASVGGWDVNYELQFLQEEGLGYEPDIVILALYPNDFVPGPSRFSASRLTDEGRIESRPSWMRWIPFRAIYAAKRSAVLTLLRDRMGVLLADEDIVNSLIANEIDLETHPRIVHTYNQLLEFQKTCRENGASFVLAAVPSLNLFRAPRGAAAYLDHLRDFSRGAGFQFVDLSDDFWNEGDQERMYLYPWDNHLSPRGHELIARQLVTAVAAELSR